MIKMLAIKVWNQWLNPMSYSQLIGWFAWNCSSEVIFYIWDSLNSGRYMFSKKQFLSILSSFDLDWGLGGLLKDLEVRGFNTTIQLVLLAERLNSSEKALYTSLSMSNWIILQKNSPKFHAKVNYLTNAIFTTRYIK